MSKRDLETYASELSREEQVYLTKVLVELLGGDDELVVPDHVKRELDRIDAKYPNGFPAHRPWRELMEERLQKYPQHNRNV